MIYSVNRGPKSPQLSIEDFDPTREVEEKPKQKIAFADFAAAVNSFRGPNNVKQRSEH